MKKRFLPLLFLVFLLSMGYSISKCPATKWTAIIGVPGASTLGTGIAVSPDQQVFVTGTTTGSLSGQAISSASDVFVTRYNPFGGLQWIQQLGVIQGDLPGIAVDVNDNSYVTGTTGGNFDGLPKTGSKDTFVIMLNPSGEKQWTALLGVAGVETRGYGITADESGFSYVTGTTAGNLDGQTLTGSADAFITKYDPSGVKQWTQLFGVAGFKTEGHGIGVDGSGNIYVTGNVTGLSNDKISFFVTKYSSTGANQWMVQLGDKAWGNAIAVDASGNCYMTGTTLTTFDGLDLGTGSLGASFITKYNSAGEKQWTELLGSINEGGGITGWGFSTGNTITLDESGNCYVAGWMLKFVNEMATVVFIEKFNSAGEKQWTRRLGAAPTLGTYTYTIGAGVAVDQYPNVFVTGYVEGGGSLDGQPAIGVTDAFITSKFNCAENQYYDATSDTCVSIPACDNGMTFDQDAVACECPSGTHLVGSACVTQCPTNQYWDSASNSCKVIPTCYYGMIFNQVTGVCACPAGTQNVGGMNVYLVLAGGMAATIIRIGLFATIGETL